MIIKVKETVTTEREIEINFPLYTYDEKTNKFFYNYAEKKCITIDLKYNSIQNWSYFNEGLEFKEIKKDTFFRAFDSNMNTILEILNK